MTCEGPTNCVELFDKCIGNPTCRLLFGKMQQACEPTIISPQQRIPLTSLELTSKFDLEESNIIISEFINFTWVNTTRFIISQRKESCNYSECLKSVREFYSVLNSDQRDALLTCSEKQCRTHSHKVDVERCLKHSSYFR